MSKNTSPKTNSVPSFVKKMRRNMWLMFFGAIIFAVLFFVTLSFSDLPETAELENPSFEYATRIYTADNKELGRYFRTNRDWVYPEDLNPHLINALVATEDERFYNHNGIDYKGSLRAVFYLGKKGGASTITQQLSKLLFHERATSFIPRVLQKFKEWIIASRIEKRYTKDEIISMYLNKFDFLNDSDGVAAAAITYFGKSQDKLDIQEAAMLVGMLKNPGIYSPINYPERAKIRREVVLKQMVRSEFISQEKYDDLRQLPLDMSKFSRQEDSKGLAPYFRSELTKWVKGILKQDEYYKPDGTRYNLYTDGLKIYTTIDSRYQTHAEAAVKKNIIDVQDRYFRVWEGKDPWTYKADEQQEKIRRESLNNLIRQTQLYKSIKDNYMSKIFADIQANIQGTQLRDVDIFRMLKQDKDKNYFSSSSYVSKSQAARYTTIMNSEHFPELKKQWKKMEIAVKKSFSKEKDIKVFDYKTGGYTNRRMTPLDSIKFHRMHMQSGMLAIEPSTGYVRAWVGGINHDVFQYDHINSNRQVGSTFKPFVYSTAILMNGISPCWEVDDIQYSIPANDPNFGLMKKWEPSNSDNKFSGQPLSLYQGLKQSKNSVSVYLMKELGNVEPVRNLAENMGIPKDKIPPYPSIALGTPELSLYDMTSAYATFANKGLYNKPVFVTRIEDREGRVIYNSVPEQSKALPEDFNYVMVSMLKKAAEFIAPKFNVEVGGKTGTTNDYVDGWFMGITPNLAVGTWVGGEDSWIRFRTLANGQGGVMARPAFVEFVQRLENDPSTGFDETARFTVPTEMDVEINCEVYNNIKKQYQEDDIEEDLFDDIDEF